MKHRNVRCKCEWMWRSFMLINHHLILWEPFFLVWNGMDSQAQEEGLESKQRLESSWHVIVVQLFLLQKTLTRSCFLSMDFLVCSFCGGNFFFLSIESFFFMRVHVTFSWYNDDVEEFCPSHSLQSFIQWSSLSDFCEGSHSKSSLAWESVNSLHM